MVLKIGKDNIDLNGSQLKLLLMIGAFTISAYATCMVFTYNQHGAEWWIGILKTLVLESCKLMFYYEYRKKGGKRDLYLWLWIFFLVMSLLHTMNFEISLINKEYNKKIEKFSGYSDNEQEIKVLREERIGIVKEKQLLIDEKKTVIDGIKNDKKGIEEAFQKNINDTNENTKKTINSMSNKIATRKTQRFKENSQNIKNLTKEKSDTLKQYNDSISSESKRYDNQIKLKNDRINELNTEIKNREDNKTTMKTETKETSGLNVLIDLILNLKKEKGKTLITILITFMVAIGFDLAGCKCYQAYQESKKVGNRVIAESQNTSGLEEELSKKDQEINKLKEELKKKPKEIVKTEIKEIIKKENNNSTDEEIERYKEKMFETAKTTKEGKRVATSYKKISEYAGLSEKTGMAIKAILEKQKVIKTVGKITYIL